MLRPTTHLLSERVHKPLIHFLGKRQWPAKPEPPHAHPAGPPDYKAHFDEFLRRLQSYKPDSVVPAKNAIKVEKRQSGEGTGAYDEFWQAPTRLWQPRIRRLSEEEIECVLSGGASH